jgi:hypothetical protein
MKSIFRRYLLAFAMGTIVATCTFAGLTLYASSLTGAVTLRQMAQAMRNNHKLIGLPFDLRWWALLKINRLALSPAEVVYISSSRAGTFREQMFRPYQFYNLSFTAWSIDQAISVLSRLKGKMAPRVVIVGLDYFMFTPTWAPGYTERNMHFSSFGRYELENGIDFIKTALKNRNILSQSADDFLGAQSKETTEGFRWDGSYRFSNAHLVSSERLKGSDYLLKAMPGAPSVDIEQFAALERFAMMAKLEGIKVIGIQLPFVREGVDFLNFNEPYKHYSGVWREFGSKQFRSRLADIGIDFFDLSKSEIDDHTENFIDAYHPSELGALRSMIYLAQDPVFKSALPLINVGTLKCDLASALSSRSTYFSYDQIETSKCS